MTDLTIDNELWTIDADAHLDETEDTWNWLQPAEEHYRPTTAYPKNADPSRPPPPGSSPTLMNRYWVVEGQRRPRFYRDDDKTQTTIETRELLDPMARVRQMDAMHAQVQVLYPSLFLVQVCDKPEVDLALKRSYNRWVADRCHQTGGRLRWVCLPPLDNIEQSIEELRFAKANGACAVMKKGDREAGHYVNEEYYFRFYEECERLDLPVVFHIGAGVLDTTPAREFPWSRYVKLAVPPIHAFYNLTLFNIPHRFPGIRWGFIETGSSWVPYMAYDLMRRLKKMKENFAPGYSYEKLSDVVTKNRFYITCQVDEDLPYILRYTTEDHLLVGSDYTHADASGEMDFRSLLIERAACGDISQTALRKIASANGKAFYGL